MRKSKKKLHIIPCDELIKQAEKDKALFWRLSVNLRRARREELEQLWPSKYLPDAEEPLLPIGPETPN